MFYAMLHVQYFMLFRFTFLRCFHILFSFCRITNSEDGIRTGRGELCEQTCAQELGAEESVSKSNEEGDEPEKSWSTGMQRTEVVRARTGAANSFFHVIAARLKL